MPAVTVSEKTYKVVERYQKMHAPGKAPRPSMETKTLGEAADFLVGYADRRLTALAKNNAKNAGKKRTAKPKAAKAAKEKKEKVRAAPKPKTGLAGKLARTKKSAPAKKLEGNRKLKKSTPSVPGDDVPPPAVEETKPVDTGDSEDDEPDPLAETPKDESEEGDEEEVTP